ncbi:PREDICTED: uncharacterized protein LOC109169706 isoform X2 [Ipomoea nil]|uniref:uncharacterized protein LOC109169706 isoform X2 n=1 Tax=Ipomoea nil TaxID=35883 RepID=UPI000900FF0E|nr:PREDICTED: uncharacterized protein LOC109169706 isoform X2 [Ipomoea nil]
MTKKSPAKAAATEFLPVRQVLWVWWKLVITLSLALCVLAFLRLQRYSPSDSELAFASGRSRTPDGDLRGNPKIAFLFLAKTNLPLDFLWGSFFENADIANFSIYIHTEPGFVFDKSTTRSAFFYNRQLKNSIKVAWGESSMIEAEKLLFAAALGDPRNQRFVLLSDSCVPLHKFSYIYKYLVNSPRSFVDSFIDKNDGRYNPWMTPFIPKSKWRKGSQWITLIRKHAKVVADDEAIFPVFEKFCKKLQKQHNCISDEHYVPTLLEMLGLVGELERRTVTYTVWNYSETKTEKNWHPVTFSYRDARSENIKKIKDITNVYYDTEFRTEWCRNNHTFVPCFLFGRKFSPAAAMRLLSDEVVSQFDPSTIMH